MAEQNNQISADELLKKLKDNLDDGEEFASNDEEYAPKKYKFKRSKKEQTEETPTVDDYVYESPVPKSNIEDLDVDALMKMYLTEEDYNVVNKKNVDPLSETLDSTEIISDGDVSVSEYTVPDEETYRELNVDGKVCDIPDEAMTATETATAETVAVKTEETPAQIDFKEDETISAGDLNKYIGSLNNTIDDVDFDELFGDMPVVPLEIPQNEEEIVEEPVKEEDVVDSEKTVVVTVEETPKVEIPSESLEDTVDSSVGFIAEEEKTTPSDTDTNILLALGMDDELNQKVGENDAEKLRTANEEVSSQINGKNVDPVEFKNISEIKSIGADYKKKFLLNAISILGTGIMTIVIFFYENIISLGGSLPSALDPTYYPTVNVMVGLQLLFISFIFALPYFVKGAKAIWAKKPVVESLLPIILLINTVFSFISMTFVSGTYFKSYFLPASVAVLFVEISRRFDLNRENMSFKVISSKRNKFALEALDISNAELEAEAINSYSDETGDIFRIRKSRFIDGFFRRNDIYPSYKLYLNFFFLGIIVSGLIAFGVAFASTGVLSNGIITGYSAMMFSIPASLVIVFSYPLYKRTKIAFDDGAAYIGEAVSDEYSSAAFVSFEDREAFPTGGVKIQNIECVSSNSTIDAALCYAACIYRRLGGPLSDVLNVTTAEITLTENVEIIKVEKNGVTAAIDGKSILLGKAEFLRNMGVIPNVSEHDDELISSGKSIFYLAVDGDLYCKFYVKYSLDTEFYSLVKSMYNSGVCIGIKTLDPNIDDEMLGLRIDLSKYPIRVLNYLNVNDRVTESDRIDSGIVSKRSAKSLLRAFGLCDRIKLSIKPGYILSGIGIFVGCALASLFTVFNSVTNIASVWPALIQIFWFVPCMLWVSILNLENE